VAAILFAAVAGVFLATSVLFALAPDSLASSGFLASPSLGRRALGFAAFGLLGMAAVVQRLASGSSDYGPLGLAGVSCAALTWHLSRPHINALFASSAAGAHSPR
jgi:hypothetical protein